MDAVGVHQYWGFTPALNDEELWRKVVPPADAANESKPLNVLLAQPGDIRNILKTIAERARDGGKRPINFYVYDFPDECIARHIFLLSVALDWEIPLKQRCNLFLEVFGNCLVQERTSTYISNKRKELIDLLCNQKGPLRNLVDFKHLKFKTRDQLEDIFKSYDYRIPFDVKTLRDYRLRHHFGERYDFRDNVIDWDYQMTVRQVAGCIHRIHYRHWRNTGVAFEFGDQTYTVPNRTMASYARGKERGKSTLRRGFWCDVITSPYYALGIACHAPKSDKAAQDLFDITGRGTGVEQWRHTAVEISVYNVLSWLYAIETGKEYSMRRRHELYSGTGTELGAADVESTVRPKAPPKEEGEASHPETKEEAGSAPSTAATKKEVTEEDVMAAAIGRAKQISKALQGIKIHFMTGAFGELAKKKAFHNLFDVVHLSGFAAHYLDEEAFPAVLKPHAVVVTDNACNVPILKPEQRIDFEKRVVNLASKCGLAFLGMSRNVVSDRFSIGTHTAPLTKEAMKREEERKAKGKRRTLRRITVAKPQWSEVKGSSDGIATATASPSILHDAPRDVDAGKEYIQELDDPLSQDEDLPRAEQLVWAWDTALASVRQTAWQERLDKAAAAVASKGEKK